jgi:eukaryotic-like serine/threonine-protein kinase
MTHPVRLGRYEVLGLVARGGMGAVYKARDPALDRVVAVKTVHSMLLGTEELREEFLERFRREARAAGRLAHPHIVSVHDFGVDEPTSTPFIVMEYVPGVSLEALLKEGHAMPVAQALEIVEQVASALEEAHAHGIVHRDVKPANVYLDERGRVKVGDFGIARLDGSDLTQAGVAMGTPGYAAPEVVQGGTADARADVFALGALAYRLLTGEKPFRGVTRETIAVDVLQWDPPPPHTVRPEVPAHVSAAVMRALAKSPGERTAGAAAFLREVRGAEAEPLQGPVLRTAVSPARTAPGSPPTATVGALSAPRSRLVVAAVIAVALAAGLGLLWLSLRGPDAAPEAAVTRPAARPAALAPSAPAPSPRPVVRTATPAPPRTDPRIDQLKSVLDKVLAEGRKVEDRSQQGDDPPPRAGGRGKGHGKGKKH